MITFPGPVSALVTLPVAPDRDGIARVLRLERLAHDALPDLRTTIPAFNRLLVEGSPRSWNPTDVESTLAAAAEACLAATPRIDAEDPMSLPVCYDPELAPDLEDVAANAGVGVAEVARLHSGATYAVLATGFAPGFAYMGDVDARIAMPRLTTPRPRVEAGAVGIADRRTGIYPAAGPGGWRLIGRVPSALFADAAERIARFRPGGSVEFRSIDRDEYEAAGG
ncbi:MAG: allophanate hydrolase subunit 1 [Gemmatimonadetes bacterium]|nr:allophanate hydrolase subunit 1 [Candidatus Palauibacter rhopaloidicola]